MKAPFSGLRNVCGIAGAMCMLAGLICVVTGAYIATVPLLVLGTVGVSLYSDLYGV